MNNFERNIRFINVQLHVTRFNRFIKLPPKALHIGFFLRKALDNLFYPLFDWLTLMSTPSQYPNLFKRDSYVIWEFRNSMESKKKLKAEKIRHLRLFYRYGTALWAVVY